MDNWRYETRSRPTSPITFYRIRELEGPEGMRSDGNLDYGPSIDGLGFIYTVHHTAKNFGSVRISIPLLGVMWGSYKI